MRTVSAIYEEYRIMPGLQMHQLRVAAVGKLICDSLNASVDTEAVVQACLFHDMGNIIKSDLVLFPELLGDKGVEFWQAMKDEFIRKFGPNEHDAALVIAEKVGLPDVVASLISGVGFSNLEEIRDRGSIEMKIVEYADLRVAPLGILPMHGRIEEAGKRYIGRHPDMPTDTSRLDALNAAADEVERQIFARCSLHPEDITDERAAPVVEELRKYVLA